MPANPLYRRAIPKQMQEPNDHIVAPPGQNKVAGSRDASAAPHRAHVRSAHSPITPHISDATSTRSPPDTGALHPVAPGVAKPIQKPEVDPRQPTPAQIHQDHLAGLHVYISNCVARACVI
jgi:hypothetical protein